MAGDERRFSRRRGRILAHIVALRRTQAVAGSVPDDDAPAQPGADREAEQPDVERLQRRVDHLEASLEGLQDAVHRESERRDREIAALARELRPDTMARALSDDARRRGI